MYSSFFFRGALVWLISLHRILEKCLNFQSIGIWSVSKMAHATKCWIFSYWALQWYQRPFEATFDYDLQKVIKGSGFLGHVVFLDPKYLVSEAVWKDFRKVTLHTSTLGDPNKRVAPNKHIPWPIGLPTINWLID